MVWRITFCVCCPAPDTLFFCFFANLGLCLEIRTPGTVAATAQILVGVYLTCVASLSCRFGGWFEWGSSFFVRVRFLVVPFTCVHRCNPDATTLHTGGATAQILGRSKMGHGCLG